MMFDTFRHYARSKAIQIWIAASRYALLLMTIILLFGETSYAREKVDAPVAQAPLWQVMSQTSTLSFTAIQGNAPLAGGFKHFDTVIRFDPENLRGSSIHVEVKMESLFTDSKDAVKELPGKVWFAVMDYPIAIFQSNDIRQLRDNNFEAHGILTMKGHSEPIVVTFSLLEYSKPNPIGGHAKVTGKTTIQRSRFGVGEGEWASTNMVADAVDIELNLEAKTLDAKQNTQ